jgi:hypothetical protein
MNKNMRKLIWYVFICTLFVISSLSCIAKVINIESYPKNILDLDDLVVTIATDKSVYKLGETVTITINITNTDEEDIYLEFCCSPPAGGNITDENGKLIYWFEGLLMVIDERTIKAGETEILDIHLWNQLDADMNQVPDGNYHIDGWSVAFWYQDSIYDRIQAETPITICINYNYGVKLSCDDPYNDVKPGDTTTFIVEIANIGALDDSYNVTVGSIEDIICKINGVNADQFDPYEITLLVSESTTFEVTAEVEESVPKKEWSLIVDAYSQNETNVYNSLSLIVNIKSRNKQLEKSQFIQTQCFVLLLGHFK